MVRTDGDPHSLKPRPAFDIVAFAASAGGVFALTEVLGRLPAGFDAVVVVVQHLDPRHRSLMPQVMGRRSKLPVVEGVDGMELERGRVYLAPPELREDLARSRQDVETAYEELQSSNEELETTNASGAVIVMEELRKA